MRHYPTSWPLRPWSTRVAEAMVFVDEDHRSQVIETMAQSIDCGPFDGGCVVFAQALQQIHGGEIHVLEGSWIRVESGERPMAQHAVLKLPDGRYADADGIGTAQQIMDRFLENEGLGELLRLDDVRPMARGDLPEAIRDDGVVARLVGQLVAKWPTPWNASGEQPATGRRRPSPGA